MHTLSASLQLVIRRALRNWRLLITTFLGVTVAVALLASGPPYAAAVTEFGLRRALGSADAADSQVRVSSFQRELTRERHAELDGTLVSRLQEQLMPWLRDLVRSMTSRTLVVGNEDGAFPGARANFVFYEWLDDHTHVVEGEFPGPYGVSAPEVPVAISARVAEDLKLAVGDLLTLAEGEDKEASARARIVGIIEPLDLRDPYWFGRQSPLQPEIDGRFDYLFALLVHRDAFFDQVMALYPRAGVGCTWGVLLDLGSIDPGNWGEMQAGLAALQADVGLKDEGFLFDTSLPDILTEYQHKAIITRAVLLVLIVEVTLLVLYYIAMMSSMVVRQQSKEIAVLKSRGGSRTQVGTMQMLEAGLVCAVAAVAGSFLAVAFVQVLPHLGPFANLVAGSQVPTFALSPQVVWLAVAVAFFGWLALVLPTVSVARRTVVTLQRALARPPRASWWHRTYADVLLLLLGGVAFWQLRSYEAVVARTFVGDLRIDPVLLASPALLMLAGALVFLRIIPLLLSIGGRFFARIRGVSVAIGVWHLARNPVHYSRLVLLLSLAAALGLFSTGFGATLARSHAEQAHYATGADLRVSTRSPRAESDYRALPGVAEVSTAFRTEAVAEGRRFSRVALLAADLTMPSDGQQPSFLRVTSGYRDDFADEPLQALLGRLAADAPAQMPGVELPGQPAAIGVWAYSRPDWQRPRDYLEGDSDLDRVRFGAKLVDSEGVVFRLEFSGVPDMAEPLDAEANPIDAGETGTSIDVVPLMPQDPGWRYLRTPLVREDGSAPVYPVRLLTLFFEGHAIHSSRQVRETQFVAAINLDDLTVEQGDGRRQVIQDFEGMDAAMWRPISQDVGVGGPSQPVGMVPDDDLVRNGRLSLQLDLSFLGSRSVLGLGVAGAAAPTSSIILLVSAKFLADTDLEVGSNARLSVAGVPLTFQVAGVLHYFPTLYETSAASFAVCNRDRLLAELNAYPERVVEANEVWIEVDGDANLASLAETLAQQPGVEQIWQREEMRRNLRSEPLSLGLDGLLAISYAVAVILSIVGFTVYFGLTARQRTVEFGVLRAIGLSAGQLLALLSIEQIVLIVLGLAGGTGLGVALSRLILPFMAITFGGQEIVPPFLPVVDWSAINRLYITLLLAFATAFAGATVVLMRMKVHRVLKIGEE